MPTRRITGSAGVLVAIMLAALAVVGCSPGSGGSSASSSTTDQPVKRTDPAKLGKLTLTVWDKGTSQGANQALNELNREFQQRHPNIKIKRVAREFSDLKTTLKLALSSSKPPDVVQVNQGYGDLGAFARAGLLRPVNDYAKAYGWLGRYQPNLLAQNRATRTGGWGEGDLYGISTTAELVGVYYNRAQLDKLGVAPPTTWPEFTAALAKAKAAGMLPIQYGASDKAPAIHEFGTVLTQLAGPKAVDDLVFNRDAASWNEPNVVKALQTLSDWSKQGYLPSTANGYTGAKMAANFAKGQGVFMISGSWWGGDVKANPDIGFTALRPGDGQAPVAMGGLGLLWSITSKTKHADAAAAYIDFITSRQQAHVIAQSGDLPANTGTASAGSIEGELSSAIQGVLKAGSLVPYLDYTTPTFYDTISAQVQQVTAGRTSPKDAAAAMQQEASTFDASR